MAIRSGSRSAAPETVKGNGSGLTGRTLLGGIAVVAVLLPLVSSAVGLYDRITHWGKVVHGVEGVLVGVAVLWLVLGWRDRERIDMPTELATLVTVFAGIVFGVVWETVEFVIDWSTYSNLQKSNSDTMTDFLWNDIGAVIGALLAARLYYHVLADSDHQELGSTAVWLFDGPSRFLDRHGVAVTIAVVLVVAGGVLAVWFASRPLPGLGLT